MSELSFENSNNRFNNEEKIPLLQRLLIKSGFAKDRKKAEKILIIISIVLLVLAALIFFIKTRTPKVKTVNIRARPPVQRVEVENQAQENSSSQATNQDTGQSN